jgi:hypothetical protein
MKNAFFILSTLLVMGFASSAYAEKVSLDLKPIKNLQLFKDTDGDGVPDFRDKDVDGNGIADAFGSLSPADLSHLFNMDLDDFADMTEEEMEEYLEGLLGEDDHENDDTDTSSVDTDGDGTIDEEDADDDNDGIPDDEDADDDGDGILDIFEKLNKLIRSIMNSRAKTQKNVIKNFKI